MQFHVKKCFIGVDGLDISHGLTTTTILQAEVIQTMIKISKKVVVVADKAFVEELKNRGIDVLLIRR